MTLRSGAGSLGMGGAAAAVAMLGVCGCGSSAAKPQPTSNSAINPAGAWHDRLIVSLVSCFYRRNLIPHSTQLGAEQLPVHDGRLATSSPGDQDDILRWYSDNGSNVIVKGNEIGNWVVNAAQNTSQWPTSLCGKIPPPPH